MLSAAPVLDEGGRPFAALGLAMRPDDSFTRIMQVARFGRTGETYAFDRRGRLISESRFDDQLKRIGLLPDHEGASSILTVDLRNPLVDMVRGGRPKVDRASQPLTLPVAAAIAGGRGVDVGGYRDYRGIPSIGAWAWIEEYDFGMITEIDAEEALPSALGRPLDVLDAARPAGVGVPRHLRLHHRGRSPAKGHPGGGPGGANPGAIHPGGEDRLRRDGLGLSGKARPPPAPHGGQADGPRTHLARRDRPLRARGAGDGPPDPPQHDHRLRLRPHARGPLLLRDGVPGGDRPRAVGGPHGPQPEARVVAILVQACGSLAEAHDVRADPSRRQAGEPLPDLPRGDATTSSRCSTSAW